MLIGLTGTNGAGKGEIAAFLAAERRIRAHSLSDVIRDALAADGLEPAATTSSARATTCAAPAAPTSWPGGSWRRSAAGP